MPNVLRLSFTHGRQQRVGKYGLRLNSQDNTQINVDIPEANERMITEMKIFDCNGTPHTPQATQTPRRKKAEPPSRASTLSPLSSTTCYSPMSTGTMTPSSAASSSFDSSVLYQVPSKDSPVITGVQMYDSLGTNSSNMPLLGNPFPNTDTDLSDFSPTCSRSSSRSSFGRASTSRSMDSIAAGEYEEENSDGSISEEYHCMGVSMMDIEESIYQHESNQGKQSRHSRQYLCRQGLFVQQDRQSTAGYMFEGTIIGSLQHAFRQQDTTSNHAYNGGFVQPPMDITRHPRYTPDRYVHPPNVQEMAVEVIHTETEYETDADEEDHPVVKKVKVESVIEGRQEVSSPGGIPSLPLPPSPPSSFNSGGVERGGKEEASGGGERSSPGGTSPKSKTHLHKVRDQHDGEDGSQVDSCKSKSKEFRPFYCAIPPHCYDVAMTKFENGECTALTEDEVFQFQPNDTMPTKALKTILKAQHIRTRSDGDDLEPVVATKKKKKKRKRSNKSVTDTKEDPYKLMNTLIPKEAFFHHEEDEEKEKGKGEEVKVKQDPGGASSSHGKKKRTNKQGTGRAGLRAGLCKAAVDHFSCFKEEAVLLAEVETTISRVDLIAMHLFIQRQKTVWGGECLGAHHRALIYRMSGDKDTTVPNGKHQKEYRKECSKDEMEPVLERLKFLVRQRVSAVKKRLKKERQEEEERDSGGGNNAFPQVAQSWRPMLSEPPPFSDAEREAYITTVERLYPRPLDPHKVTSSCLLAGRSVDYIGEGTKVKLMAMTSRLLHESCSATYNYDTLKLHLDKTIPNVAHKVAAQEINRVLGQQWRNRKQRIDEMVERTLADSNGIRSARAFLDLCRTGTKLVKK